MRGSVSGVRHPAELTAAFRQQGLKVTPQRQLLFRLLHDNATHPTAESLFQVAGEVMPGISLRTVYQTLNDLASMGELHVVNVGQGSNRFDPNVDHHHHAVCEQCGEMRDVYVSGIGGLTVAGLDGFDTATTSIVFTGHCRTCAALGSPDPIHQPTTPPGIKGARS
jgi:Fe2+ or Zn2+ uptake regulation protein